MVVKCIRSRSAIPRLYVQFDGNKRIEWLRLEHLKMCENAQRVALAPELVGDPNSILKGSPTVGL